jgi:zinc and cadmium transporter
LIADALHNFIGGLAVAGAFLIDIRVGISAWIAAAAHEVPQELGDFGILIHGGWKKGRALLYNLLSALTFLIGGLIAYSASLKTDVTFLLPFAAGNFIYIAAADLIPEIKHEESASPNFSRVEKIKAALRGIMVVSPISYAQGEERPYGNTVYNRTNGISATGASSSDREI